MTACLLNGSDSLTDRPPPRRSGAPHMMIPQKRTRWTFAPALMPRTPRTGEEKEQHWVTIRMDTGHGQLFRNAVVDGDGLAAARLQPVNDTAK